MSKKIHSKDQLTLLPEDSLANLLVWPGSDKAQKITATSGKKCAMLLKYTDPLGCLGRMLLESSTWHSTQCYLNWQELATPHRHLLFQLVPSMPHIEGIEFGLLPTPLAQEGAGMDTVKLTDVIEGRRYTENGKIENPELTGLKLQPEFVELMMGFPIGWTDLNALETP